MTNLPPSGAAELAIQGAQRLETQQDDCEQRLALAEWVTDNLGSEAELNKARKIARAEPGNGFAYFNRAVRLVAGTMELSSSGANEYVILVAMPVFISGQAREGGTGVFEWGSRQGVERYFENLFGLSMLSLRLACFPVDVISMSKLSAVQQQKLMLDLQAYGDSKLLRQAPLPQEGAEVGRVWPGILRVRVDRYETDFPKFMASRNSPKAARFREYAHKEFSRDLVPACETASVTTYPLLQFADALAAYRQISLVRKTRAVLKEKPQISQALHRYRSGVLTLWFLGPDDTLEGLAETDFSEDAAANALGALNYLAKPPLSLKLKHVTDMPRLPSLEGLAY